MFNSIEQWVNIYAKHKVFIKRSGSGTKLYEEPVDIFVYPVGDQRVATDDKGSEFVSRTQFYVDGRVMLKPNDIILFEEQEYIIGSVSSYYREGRCDIRVGYAR